MSVRPVPVPDRPQLSFLGFLYAPIVTGKETGGAYELFLFGAPAGHAAPPHVHSREDEAFYILDGEFEVTVDGKAHKAPPGAYIHLSRGVPHSFRNAGRTPGRVLAWVFPATLEGFFGALSHPLPEGSDQPLPVSESDVARLMKIAPQFGLTILAG
ncbi:MAG: cupin domain-containing protein [Planctomycetaceae bacterium]